MMIWNCSSDMVTNYATFKALIPTQEITTEDFRKFLSSRQLIHNGIKEIVDVTIIESGDVLMRYKTNPDNVLKLGILTGRDAIDFIRSIRKSAKDRNEDFGIALLKISQPPIVTKSDPPPEIKLLNKDSNNDL